jgi:4-amino-4-deoxy-L-arabinose transferase-like glycosyltransferase
MLAPAIAGLVGPGIVAMTAEFKNKRSWRQFILPVAFAVTSLIEIIYVWGYSALRTWLVPVMIVFVAASSIFMVLNYIKPNRLRLVLMSSCLLGSLLAAPLYWSLTNIIYLQQSFTMPYAGPELASEQRESGPAENQTGTSALEKYLVAHYQQGSYLVVAQSSNEVAQYIIDTGLPAVAYGGFTGSDNALSVEKLKQLVEDGKVTYFMVTGQQGSTNSDIISYVEQNATLIDPSEYNETNSQQDHMGMEIEMGVQSLYLFQK